MAGAVAGIDSRLIAFVLPSMPESVRTARFCVRAVLGFHRLGEYADDAAAITSELVTNAVQHVCGDGTGTIEVILADAEPGSRDRGRVGTPLPMARPCARPRPGASGAAVSGSWRRCLLTGAGARKRAANRSSRYSRRSREREAGTASPRRRHPGRSARCCRREHPHPAPAQGVEPGEARRADGLAKRIHRVRRRRPPRWPAARLHRQGNQAAGRDLRCLTPAAHGAMRDGGGHPPAGFACLACGAAPGQGEAAHPGDEGQRTVTGLRGGRLPRSGLSRRAILKANRPRRVASMTASKKHTALPFSAATAESVLVMACEIAGLDAGGARLLRLGENALFHLPVESAVVRIARTMDYWRGRC